MYRRIFWSTFFLFHKNKCNTLLLNRLRAIASFLKINHNGHMLISPSEKLIFLKIDGHL